MGRLLKIRWLCPVALGCVIGLAVPSSGDTASPPPKNAGSSTKKKANANKVVGKTPAKHRSSGKRSKSKLKSAKKRGQQEIQSERARQIQEALVREHYLEGMPSGRWDAETQAALRRYQADQGWQSKTVPDSRALIKLGLGPNHDHLLNPESAMTSGSAKPASGSGGDANSTTSDPVPDTPQE